MVLEMRTKCEKCEAELAASSEACGVKKSRLVITEIHCRKSGCVAAAIFL